jgi:hypothetical protein
MARRKTAGPSVGIAAELRRRGVDAEATGLEAADDNLAICTALGISKPTLVRWRAERGFPEADFVIGLREFTWRRRIMAWIQTQPKTHPMKGRRPSTTVTEAA